MSARISLESTIRRPAPAAFCTDEELPMATIPQISCTHAWQMLLDDSTARLIDIRTRTEWETIGVPDATTTGRPTRFVTWTDEAGEQNPYFLDQTTDGLAPDTPLLLLCRSGVRSQAAAEFLAAAGFTRAHNITGGFEGPVQADGTRAGGWRGTLPETTHDHHLT